MTQLRDLFTSAGCDGFVHVHEIDEGREIALDEDAVVVSASVFKVAVALAFFNRACSGDVDATERVRLTRSQRTGGPTGLSLFADEVEVSLRDLATSMLVVSDNAATDVLIERLGLERINALTRSLGLEQTVLLGDVRWTIESIARDAGFAGWDEFAGVGWEEADEALMALTLERLRTARALNPAHATRTTPREMTMLLSAIWRDEAGPLEACRELRRLMAQQLTRHRIAAGFPRDVRISAKTGSLFGSVRNEIGVVEFRDGGRYAVAVFTRAHALYEHEHEINAAIGAAARLAVESLRG